MASRMEKYYNQSSSNTKRSQKNQLLYQEIDNLYQKETDITRVERLLKNYQDYKTIHNRYNDETIEELDSNFQRNKYNTYRLKADNLHQREMNIEEDQKIRRLIDHITMTSYLNKRKSNLIEQNLFSKKEYKKKATNINDLFNELKYSSPKKEETSLNDFFDVHKDDEKEKTRRANLKVKIIVGILFLINTIAIFFLIYRAIK